MYATICFPNGAFNYHKVKINKLTGYEIIDQVNTLRISFFFYPERWLGAKIIALKVVKQFNFKIKQL